MANDPNPLKTILFSSLLIAGLAVGCTSAPPYYGPRIDGGGAGYTDEKLGSNRYRVTYSGTASTNRRTVENYLLIRAAEVTLASGFPAFMFDTRDTKARTTYYSTFDPWPNWPGYGWYWHSWPYDMTPDVTSRTRYEAYAEIVTLTADQAAHEARAIDAQDILNRLKAPPPPTH